MNQSCRNYMHLASFGGDYRTGDIIGWCNLHHKIVLLSGCPDFSPMPDGKPVKYVYDSVINAFVPDPNSSNQACV